MCERSQPRDSKNSTMCGGSTAVECSNTLTLTAVNNVIVKEILLEF